MSSARAVPFSSCLLTRSISDGLSPIDCRSVVRRPDVLQMKLVGANQAAKVTALDELPGKSNYFIGNDPKKWRTDVPTYGKVKYQGVYPGIDLVYYGNQRQLEYDFVVAPGADRKAITLETANRNSKIEACQSKTQQ